MKRMIVIVVSLVLGGCGTGYYKVTEPNSGKTYYTNDWMALRYNMNGAVRFHDDASGKDVTLQSSEVEDVSKEEWQAATGK